MKITECVHLQYWVFVSISSLEGCIIISYRACLVSLNPGFDMSNKASHLPIAAFLLWLGLCLIKRQVLSPLVREFLQGP